jgi:hypothetical protein
MKPKPQVSSSQHHGRGDSSARRVHREFPLTDYSFQSRGEELATSSAIAEKGIAELRTFRKVSREYFRTEAGSDFLREALFFIWISCVAAWPITMMMYEMMRMMI